MATTTNYGWTTPDDTALVKDGAAAIRTLGTSIDTTTKALNPSTTLGDIEYRSSTANTNTRLGIGTTGQVLTVSGGVPAWATAASGAITLISETTASALSSLSLSSIPNTYKQLILVWSGIYHSDGATRFNMRLNNISTTTYHIQNFYYGAGSVASTDFQARNTMGGDNTVIFGQNSSSTALSEASSGYIIFDNYASTTRLKTFNAKGRYLNAATGVYHAGEIFGTLDTTSAITSIDVVRTTGTGTFTNLTNTSIRLYGLS